MNKQTEGIKNALIDSGFKSYESIENAEKSNYDLVISVKYDLFLEYQKHDIKLSLFDNVFIYLIKNHLNKTPSVRNVEDFNDAIGKRNRNVLFTPENQSNNTILKNGIYHVPNHRDDICYHFRLNFDKVLFYLVDDKINLVFNHNHFITGLICE